jgi:hypothetical protein
MDAITQLRGIERSPHFHVIVEIDKNIATLSLWGFAFACSRAVVDFAALGPRHNAASPGVEGLRVIAAGIQLLTAVKAG